MKRQRWPAITVALTLAVVLLWAAPTLAQGRGKARGQGGQGWGQGQGPGQGVGNNTCPNYPAYQSGQGKWAHPQANAGGRGPRGGGRISAQHRFFALDPITSHATP